MVSRPTALRRRVSSWAVALLALVLAGALLGCSSKNGPEKAVRVPWNGLDPVEVIDAYIDAHPVDEEDPRWKLKVPRPPANVHFDPNQTYYWYLQTSEGLIKIELLPKLAPRHVASTIYLTRLGFYDGLEFHRIIPEFMAQGGDPLGNGGGSPGFHYASEIHKKGIHDERGVVSMANADRPRTDGSQFFILFKEAAHLDGKHTVFGHVREGWGTLRSMEMLGSKDGKPKRPVLIERATIGVDTIQ
jgi:cyclophilin family peptidyl-prolyl cis-trans isomerase